ncbi:carboxyl transferase domain-containing protein [Actinomadura sp. WAC 06369]|uniref:carboxyl transferase domain-containing protein n=1 Tax=Actinomadura sp. WAC 06369 TaxID=2203193 RepID=UPI000F79FCB4|nr:carboxyl transferase domain-containing protein [Actinomadura sp. WAC 06369]RSN70508.1 acetyl-CoA carboxyl transferase [Actinomadura sp. WAC 06369]
MLGTAVEGSRVSERVGARELLRRVLDGGAWTSWDEPVGAGAETGAASGAAPGYRAELAAARERSGCDEAVLTGEGRLRGRRVAFVVSEFRFLAGSIGRATADRIVAAVERATAAGLPLLAAPSSGGTRMQEGTAAFVQMARITGAVMAHRAAGLPYLVYLRHPTTGGVFASWGSLGHMTAAEPGALIGFLGPRVYEGLHGEPFPPGVQVAENLAAKGLLDAVVPIDDLAGVASGALAVLCGRAPAPRPEPREAAEPGAVPEGPAGAGDRGGDAWDSIERSRRPGRPGVAELLRHGASDVTPLSGTGQGEADPGLLLALARFGAAPCVLVGQDRRSQRAGHPLGPAGLRVARRGMSLAAELGLPLVTVVDTPGAVLSAEAEEGGLAGEIARCLADLLTLAAPTLCLLLGEGSGGAALALLPADRVLVARHGWLSPLPPEGASVIVHRTPGRAAELAAAQGVRSADLLRAGTADVLVDELPDAADEPAAFCRRAAAAIERELSGLVAGSPAARQARYR